MPTPRPIIARAAPHSRTAWCGTNEPRQAAGRCRHAPGGGFAYVGSLHEGFPYAAEISRQGLNAFVLKYRAGLGGRVATEDLAAAMRRIGTRVEYRKYPDLGHGFGTGAGTSAQGWIDEAVRFWRQEISKAP